MSKDPVFRDLRISGRVMLIGCVLALAACGPAQIVVTSAGEVLPGEALRVLDRASATAAAEGSRAAAVTATDAAARATATAAYQGTQGALAAEQTRAALGLTVAAGQALATDAAARRTQGAQETLQARLLAFQATQAAQTPTAAAGATQGALGATQAAGAQARAESAAEFWELLRWTVLGALALGAICFCVVVLVRGLVYARAEDRRAAAAAAREAFRVLAPAHWAEWQPGDGYRVYQLPGALDAAPTVIENAPTAPDRAHAWRQAVRLFAWWGDRYGFGIRELGAAGAGVVSDPDWRLLVKLLKGAGVLADVALPGRKGRGTAWAAEWGYARLSDELARLDLPYPAGEDAPRVAFAVPTQHHNTPQHNTITPEVER